MNELLVQLFLGFAGLIIFLIYQDQKFNHSNRRNHSNHSNLSNYSIKDIYKITESTTIVNEWYNLDKKDNFFKFLESKLQYGEGAEEINKVISVKCLFKFYKSQWSVAALEQFYKILPKPYHLSVISEIYKRPISTSNFTELNIISIICSKQTEYQEIKQNIISSGNNSVFFTSAIEFLKVYNFESLKIFFTKVSNEQKQWIFPLFYSFDMEESVDFLSNYTFKAENIYLNEFNVQLQKLCLYFYNTLIPNEQAYQVLCNTCYRRPYLKKVENIRYLCCPVCEKSKNLAAGYSQVIAVVGTKTLPNEIEAWDKENKKTILVEADKLILKPNESVDYNWAISSFLHEYLSQFQQKKLIIETNGIILQENTKRLLADHEQLILY